MAAALDVAFAYFIAKAIFPRRRGPVAFLLVVAIVSNALGMVSIAIRFPAADGYPAALVLMAAAMLLAAWLHSTRRDRIWLYLVTSGMLSWLACYWGGIPPVTFALFFATSVMPPGPLLGELKLGALATAVGAVVALTAARLLHVGRFTPKPVGRLA